MAFHLQRCCCTGQRCASFLLLLLLSLDMPPTDADDDENTSAFFSSSPSTTTDGNTTSASSSSPGSSSTSISLGVILPVSICAILVSVSVSLLIYEYVRSVLKDANAEPPEDFIAILCQDEEALFEYRCIFRVGCPTVNFDMTNGYIDIEILGPDDEIQGNPVRFALSQLTDRICGEMHVFIGSFMELKEITGIRARHNDKRGSIWFYEFVLLDLSDDSVLQVCRFNTYLTNRYAIYRGKQWTEVDDEDDEDYYPELPILEWTMVEMTELGVFFVIACATAVMLFEYYDLYYSPTAVTDDGSLYRSLWDILYTIPVAIILLVVTTVSYKYYFKRNLLKSEYSLSQLNLLYWRIGVIAFKVALPILSCALSGLLCFYGTRISFIKSLYWYSTSLIMAVFVLALWTTCNKSNRLRNFFGEGTGQVTATVDSKRKNKQTDKGTGGGVPAQDSSKRDNSSSAPKAYDRYFRPSDTTSAQVNKTVYFSNQLSTSKRDTASYDKNRNAVDENVSWFGPKLYNPMKPLPAKPAKKGGGKLALMLKKLEKTRLAKSKKKTARGKYSGKLGAKERKSTKSPKKSSKSTKRKSGKKKSTSAKTKSKPKKRSAATPSTKQTLSSKKAAGKGKMLGNSPSASRRTRNSSSKKNRTSSKTKTNKKK